MKFKIFNSFEPNVEALILFIKHLKVKVNSSTINETLQQHPDYPSLLSLSDALKQWDIDNVALKRPDISELRLPFLAHMQIPGKEFLVVVTEIAEDKIAFWQTNGRNKVNYVPKSDFLAMWSGIALLAEPSEMSGEKEYLKKKKQNLKHDFIFIAFISFLLILSAIACINSFFEFSYSNNIAFGYSILLWLKITGVFVSVLLLWYEIDKKTPALQKICTGSKKTNCNSILSSKSAKLFNLISWSEIGFFYFTGGFISLLFMYNSHGIIHKIAWLNILALPYTLFSIYFQWKVAKQWCVLCLFVQALLIAEFATSILFNLFSLSSDYSTADLLKISVAFIFPVITWLLIKPNLLKLNLGKKKEIELSKLKKSEEIFIPLLEKQKKVIPATGLGIVLGNRAATNTLIKVCNTYCGPCSKAHPKLEQLLITHANLQIQIIFNSSNKKDDFSALPVKHLLSIYQKGDLLQTQNALHDWYALKEKKYDQFVEKHPLEGKLENYDHAVEAMHKWCTEMDITFTPTYFLNGYQLPDIYDVEEIDIFLYD